MGRDLILYYIRPGPIIVLNRIPLARTAVLTGATSLAAVILMDIVMAFVASHR